MTNKNDKIKNKIGIGVTERNRPEVFLMFMENIKKYFPPNAKLVVVDDASDIPVADSTFRFDDNVGIARAKNKCIELLDDCDHIFLFDSDCWPKKDKWWELYTNNKESHMCYIFKDFIDRPANDCRVIYEEQDLVAYSHARGCMLYLKHDVVNTVGGMNFNYLKWGYEHVDYSNRIYNAGLTRFRYQDSPRSSEYIYSMDEHESVASTTSIPERLQALQERKEMFDASFESTAYYSYKEDIVKAIYGESAIVTTYLTGYVDLQRGYAWTPNFSDLMPLIESMNGQKLIIIHDCFDNPPKFKNVEYVKVTSYMNPYFQRWVNYYDILLHRKDISKLFFVDATDVTMLKNPFAHIQQGKIYSGDEQVRLYNNWMLGSNQNPTMISFIKTHAQYVLLNCGIIGGYREDVKSFVKDFVTIYFDGTVPAGDFDMGLYNYVARMNHNDKIVNGPQVNTPFKSYEKNDTSWFMHK